MAGTATFIRNPAVFARLETDPPGPPRLIVCAYSAVKGFSKTVLTPDDAAFPVACDVAAGREEVPPNLSPGIALALWGRGLIILPPERAPTFAPARFDVSPARFAADGCVAIPDCIAPAAVGILKAWYAAQIEAGTARLSDGRSDRWSLHNDPAGRVIQQALLPAVQALVGAPVKPSYSFASLYRHGAMLQVHRDRPQCEFTLSVLIDHQPAPPGGVSPCALQIHPQGGGEPVDCFQRLGGGLLFKGCELLHGRRPLPAAETCWTLLLHYVSPDFEGSLD